MTGRGAVFTLLALALCWPAWEACGWLVALAGLQVADPLLRFCGLALMLGLLDAGFARLNPAVGESHG